MEYYKRGGHTVWDCKYHLVWSTKYRYPVLGGDVGQRCRELLRETARAHEIVIHAGSVNRDHVHMLLSIPPSLSVARAVQYLKGRSSHKLLSEFASLRKRYWGQHLWCNRALFGPAVIDLDVHVVMHLPVFTRKLRVKQNEQDGCARSCVRPRLDAALNRPCRSHSSCSSWAGHAPDRRRPCPNSPPWP
jgi:putative transposase